MHQIAPLTTSKCKKLSLWEGGHPPPTPSPRSLPRSGSAPSHVIFTAPLNLNPGYATGIMVTFKSFLNCIQISALITLIKYC